MTTAYYKGQEQAYTFYQLPKQLLKDKQYQAISLEARLLYCLFLDRMQLSQKNGWKDEAGQTYIIYTQNEIMEELGCSSRSAVRILKELEEANMVERKRQGMYRPTLIYVQPLRSGKGCQKETTAGQKEITECQKETTEAPKGNNMMCQKEIAEVPNGNNMMCQKETTCSFQMAGYEAPNGNTSNNNINHTEYIKTEESENDFRKNRKAEAEEAPARNSNAKLSAYQEHQYNLEKTYAQKGAAEAAKQTARQDWWPENFQELSLNQRAELWRQQARKRQRE